MANTDLTGSSEITWSPGKIGVMTTRVDCSVNNLDDGHIAACFKVRKGWAIISNTIYVKTAETNCKIDCGFATATSTTAATFISDGLLTTSNVMLVGDGSDGNNPATVKDVFPYVLTSDGYVNATMETANADSAVFDVTIGVMDLSGSDV